MVLNWVGTRRNDQKCIKVDKCTGNNSLSETEMKQYFLPLRSINIGCDLRLFFSLLNNLALSRAGNKKKVRVRDPTFLNYNNYDSLKGDPKDCTMNITNC